LQGKQIVVAAGNNQFCGVFMSCGDAKSKQWQLMGPTDASASFLFPTSGSCQTIAQPSFPACMCHMQLIANGKRKG
ncbi:hypothetical protein PENTCL1PPCAC_9516, partial [Pristionchus entomophagus]